MRVGIVAQKDNDRATRLAERLRERLTAAAEASVVVDDTTAERLGVEGVDVDALSGCDLAVSIGGDGTFLYAAHGAGATPIMGVNLGEVGFLNAVPPEDAEEAVTAAVEALRADDLDVREAPRLAPRCEGWRGKPAANEVDIQGPRRGHGGGLDAAVRIDGSPYAETHADGVLVATPTGSTAYNLSERGPLVHPSVEGLIVNGMSPAEGMSPLVVALDCEVSISLSGADRAVVVSDGRSLREVDLPAEVRVATAEVPVRIAGPKGDFFEALDKLE